MVRRASELGNIETVRIQKMENTTRKKFRLNRKDAIVFGVCSGIAQYCGLKAKTVRILTVLVGIFLTKLVIAAYVITWLIADSEED